jgi:hypothetical protein
MRGRLENKHLCKLPVYIADSCSVHKVIVEIVKKELGPHLKAVMPSWILAMHDNDREVAAVATRSFYVRTLIHIFYIIGCIHT